ncbi:protein DETOXIFICATION 13 [Citrus sinensis]|uniref:Protein DETOXIFICATION 13 n=1 Tax=Citrus sinensis TaxID=2711 RepID=A0ACB8NAE9_CITSI|nr:protein DETOXIFICATION 13 [Citrus sinensis]KAH9795089.1 protein DETOXIFICATION 13 [Citrus sinensis]
MPDFQVLELEVGDDDGTLLLEEKDTLATVYTLNTIPDGLGAAARFSNTLGAGKLKAASVAVKAVIFLANSESMIVIATLLNSRHVFFYVLSNTKEVVDHVRTMATLMCLSVVLDSLKTVLSG